MHHDDNLCLSYQARLDGEYLVVRANLEPGWHTFAMDNKQRAEEKLAGKKSLGIDRPTEIVVSGGLQTAGPWLQSQPKDFSKPELRWFSWGFEKQALFVAKMRRAGRGARASRDCAVRLAPRPPVRISMSRFRYRREISSRTRPPRKST